MANWTAILATTGAILGLANGAATLYVFAFRDRSRLKSTIRFGIPMNVAGAGPRLDVKTSSDPDIGDLVVISVTNVGPVPLTIEGAGVGFYEGWIPGFRTPKLQIGFTLGLHQLPKKIERNDPSVLLWIQKSNLLSGIRGGVSQRPQLFAQNDRPDHLWVSHSSGQFRRRLPKSVRSWLNENLRGD